MQIVNILGTEYQITYDCKTENTDGETEFYGKKICIRPLGELLDKEVTEEEKKLRQEEVVRHEVLHAMLYEAGADKYAYDEDLVQMLAVLSPKMFKVFSALGVL